MFPSILLCQTIAGFCTQMCILAPRLPDTEYLMIFPGHAMTQQVLHKFYMHLGCGNSLVRQSTI